MYLYYDYSLQTNLPRMVLSQSARSSFSGISAWILYCCSKSKSSSSPVSFSSSLRRGDDDEQDDGNVAEDGVVSTSVTVCVISRPTQSHLYVYLILQNSYERKLQSRSDFGFDFVNGGRLNFTAETVDSSTVYRGLVNWRWFSSVILSDLNRRIVLQCDT